MITFGNFNDFEKTLAEIIKQIQEQTEDIIKESSKMCEDAAPAYMDNVAYNLYEQEYGEESVLEIELPGFYEDEITAYVKDSTLTVLAKKEPKETRNYLVKSFSVIDKEFKISLPLEIASGIWSAELKNGILTYTIQKIAPKDDSMYINFKKLD